MSTTYKPFGAGYIWDEVVHARACDCNKCARKRASDMAHRIESMRHEPLQYESGKTVFVRAHLRRQPNHLIKSPKTYKYYVGLLKKQYG